MISRPHALPPLTAPSMTLRDYARVAHLTMAEVMEESAHGRLVIVRRDGRRRVVEVPGRVRRSARSRRG